MKKHPGWKNAVEEILARFDSEGYGVMFSEREILTMFDIEKPEVGSYEEFQKFNLDRLTQMDSLVNNLQEEHNLCLQNVRGQGYVLMHPDDQVTKAVEKYRIQARRKINRMVSICTNVNYDALTDEGRRAQNQALGRAAFIRAAMNKRNVPIAQVTALPK